MAVLSGALLRGEAAKTRAKGREKNENGGFSLLPPQSPRDFSALARLTIRLYYLAHPTETAMLPRLLDVRRSKTSLPNLSYFIKHSLSRTRVRPCRRLQGLFGFRSPDAKIIVRDEFYEVS